MKKHFLFIIIVLVLSIYTAHSQPRPKFDFSRQGTYGLNAKPSTTGDLLQTKQGFNMQCWLGNDATVGRGAFADFNPPRNDLGFEYPVNSGIEHLYGFGPWIGAVVDTGTGSTRRFIRTVTAGYDYDPSGPRWEMYGFQSASDTFYRTSIFQTGKPNRRNFDDDNDGRIDEDDLDGTDNDGDWNPLIDDLGSDGLSDSLEVGCKGRYDPTTNPDPAFDNYDPSSVDACREGTPLKNDRERYTQNNGRPDIGEPHVDEDYGAISESDIYIAYTDTFRLPRVPGHIPLGIKVWQKSYAWASRVKEPIIVMEYNFVNVGRRILDSVYVGTFADILLGPLRQNASTSNNDYAAYISELRTGYAQNSVDRPSTPFGVTVLGTPKPLDSLRYTFQWSLFRDHPTTSEDMYRYMSSGTIKPDEPLNVGAETQFFLGFGPFNRLKRGDTLKVVVGLVSGESVDQGFNTLKANALKALDLFGRGFTTPEVPPSPPLRITKANERVTLEWAWRPGDPKLNPLETWDDSNKFVDALPDTHWRKNNPPAGHTRGGRIFEGFKIWRSESPDYNPTSFALLRQVDVKDDLKFEYDTGLEFGYVDSNLVRGKRYWYAVTSFSIPNASVVQIPDPNGGPPRLDTLVTTSVESDVNENAALVQLPFAPSTRLGDVKVVPNPYRTDKDYTFEGGGWEGLGRFWTENRRVIWFTHLPPQSTVRIFTIAGELVSTIEHDDGNRTTPDRPVGQEEWNLLSQSGRAIASGVYVFTVESDFGRQIGKFVVIR